MIKNNFPEYKETKDIIYGALKRLDSKALNVESQARSTNKINEHKWEFTLDKEKITIIVESELISSLSIINKKR